MRKKPNKNNQNIVCPRILVYKDDYGIYVRDDGNNCWWSFHFDADDLETMKLCETSIGWKREKEAKNPDNLTPIPNELVPAFLNNHSKQYNRLTIYNIIQQMYGMTETEIDALYHRDVQAAKLVQLAIDEYLKKDKHHSKNDWLVEYHMNDWYQNAKHGRTIGWDDQRIINYLVRRKIPYELSFKDSVMIDIFGKMHPTKYSLLYEFHDASKEQEEIMDEAVEKYPDENDIDKAYYYYVEHAYGKHY